MEDYPLENNSKKEIKENIDGIKQDIEDLIHRLGNIKDNSGELMLKQLEDLSATISDIKEKVKDTGQDSLATLYLSTRKHPARNLGCAFGVGLIIGYILNK